MVSSKSKSVTVAKPRSPRQLMRVPVNARGILGSRQGHFYINPRSIDVITINGQTGHGSMVRITRKQLEKALALMDLV